MTAHNLKTNPKKPPKNSKQQENKKQQQNQNPPKLKNKTEDPTLRDDPLVVAFEGGLWRSL